MASYLRFLNYLWSVDLELHLNLFDSVTQLFVIAASAEFVAVLRFSKEAP